MKISFRKLSGAGNDFIVFDNRSAKISNLSKLAKRICHRKNGVGGDGIITLENSKASDIQMRILNPDGSEAEMCGNGVRCLAKFGVDQHIIPSKASVETLAGTIYTEVRGDVVKAKMIDPKDFRLGIKIVLEGRALRLGFVNTGVPHAVQFVPSLEKIDVDELGRKIRRHPYFAPRGTNANFISVRPENTVHVRTYERGVEGETLSCGTGSTASSLVAAAAKGLVSPVKVKTQSGEILKVYFSRIGDRFFDVYLEGKIVSVFEGRFDL